MHLLIRATFITISLLAGLFSFAQDFPDDISGLEMWLDAGSGVTLDGLNKVTDWEDISGNGHSAIQGQGSLRPLWVDGVLKGHPVVRMDGTNDFMTFPEVSNARTVFWVIKEEALASANFRCLLGHSDVFDFLRGPEKNIWHSDFTSAAIQEGVTRLNYSEIDGTANTMSEGFSLISVQAAAETRANQLTVDRGFLTRVWHGEIAEIIIYNELLNEQDFDWVENYLADKYSPDFFVDEDVEVDYGFCDTTICAAPGFESYLWSNDADTECISVNADGQYVCTVTDIFNREQSDTINVSFPGDLDFGVEMVLCEDSSMVLNTSLTLADYTFEWQDGSSDSSFQVSAGGDYFVTVTDTDLCSATSMSVSVVVNNFSSEAQIEGLLEMCAGDSIYLSAIGFEFAEVQWSDDSQGLSLVIENSDLYWVEAVDINGCIAQDTIDVVVIGQNPEVILEFEGQCQSELISIGQTGSEVDFHSWSIDGEDAGELSQFDVSFEEPGEYLIELLAENAVGCVSSRDSLLIIHPKPNAVFDYTLTCEDSEITFFSLSQVETGNINSFDWIIDGDQESGFQVFASFEDAGFIDVSHSVLTNQNCFAEIMLSVEILPAPALLFETEGVCIGDLTQFQIEIENTGAGDLDDFFWSFGDDTNSFDPEPIHLYSMSSNFEVTVNFSADNECGASHTQEVEIFNTPHADFLIGTACSGNPTDVAADVDYSGGTPNTLDWFVNGDPEFSGELTGEIVFPEMGIYEVDLQIVTQEECFAIESITVEVMLSPSPEIDASPVFGFSPLDVVFTTEEEGVNFGWDFGDFDSGIGPFVEHTYSENGVYTASIIVTNGEGCFGTSSVEIVVDDLVSDLEVADVLCTDGEIITQVTGIVENHSNYPITDMELRWWIGNDSPVSEIWSGLLQPGDFITYTFISAPNLGASNYDFICVSATDLTVSIPEESPENNTNCKLLQTDEVVVLYPPFPNPADSKLHFNVGSDQIRDVVINVFDERGRQTIQASPYRLSSGLNRLRLNVSELNAGVYTLEIQWDDHSEIQNFMISRSGN